MRTSRAGTFSKRGFTLLELVVVLAILALVTLVVYPRLPTTEAANLRGAARSLAATLRYLGDRAAIGKAHYRLHLDLGTGSLTIRTVAAGEESTTGDTLLDRRLPTGGTLLEEVRTESLGTVREGEVVVDIGPGGLPEALVIHLRNDRNDRYTVAAFPQGGKVTIREGYQEDLL